MARNGDLNGEVHYPPEQLVRQANQPDYDGITRP